MCSRSILADIRDLQKMRTKTCGLSATELALGEQTSKESQTMLHDDAIYLKTGGMIELKKMKRSLMYLYDLHLIHHSFIFSDHTDIEDDIKQQFSKESHLRDEDEEM